MRNLLLFALVLLTSNIFAQSPCNHNVTWTNRPNFNGRQLFVSVTSGSISGTQKVITEVDFGDGSNIQKITQTNTLAQFSRIYQSHGSYTMTVFVKVIDSTNQSVLCFDSSVYNVAVRSNPCSFDYSYSYHPTIQNRLTFTVNNPSGNNMTYNWDFGDGNSGTGNPVTHTYSSTQKGAYPELIVSNGFCSDTIKKYVQTHNRIRGSISYDTTVVAKTGQLKIWLIEYDSTNFTLTAIDSQTINAFQTYAYTGSYSFTNMPSGKYRVKAAFVSGQNIGVGNVPTYHTSSLFWFNANTINFNGGDAIADINMKKGLVLNGPGFIGGSIFQGANKGTSNGIEGMSVLLLDMNEDAIAFTTTDKDGKYSFSNIPTGQYEVHPENIGDATTRIAVTITNSSTNIEDINFERSDSKQTIKPKPAGITNINAATSYTVYPNPAHDVVNITWAEFSKDLANISITDISGKKVYSNAIQMNSNTAINVQNLQSGFYFLNVATENGSTTQKLLIK